MNAHGERILLVDDNMDLLENVAEILGESGFQVDVATCPEDALKLVSPGSHALMLLDMRLPNMDGAQLYRAIRAIDPGVPVLGITAHARQETVHAALEAGVCAVMSKPVDYATLLSRVEALLHGRRVLVVEDDLDQSTNLVETILDQGMAARHCGTLKDARALQEAWHPDAMLVDRRLPDGMGETLVVPGQPHPPAVLCSGAPLPEACAAPDVTLMQKPLDIPRLVATLRGNGN